MLSPKIGCHFSYFFLPLSLTSGKFSKSHCRVPLSVSLSLPIPLSRILPRPGSVLFTPISLSFIFFKSEGRISFSAFFFLSPSLLFSSFFSYSRIFLNLELYLSSLLFHSFTDFSKAQRKRRVKARKH